MFSIYCTIFASVNLSIKIGLQECFAAGKDVLEGLLEVAGVPGVGNAGMGTPGKRHQQTDFAVWVIADDAGKQTKVALVHADEEVVAVVVGGHDAACRLAGIEDDAMLAEATLGRRIDGVAALFVGDSSGGDFVPVDHAVSLHKGFHDELGHRRTADVAVTDEKYSFDFHFSF